MHQYRSARGGVVSWRQAETPAAAATLKPTRRDQTHQFRSSRGAVLPYRSGGDTPAAVTVRPGRGYLVRSRSMRARVAAANRASSVSIYRPGSDIAVSGWVASTGVNLYDCINESALDRGDYVTSPNILGASNGVFGLDSPVPAGTWAVEVDAKYINSAAQLRVHLQDAGGTDVGVSSWQALTGSDATYTLTITTTGVATRMSIEVQ